MKKNIIIKQHLKLVDVSTTSRFRVKVIDYNNQVVLEILPEDIQLMRAGGLDAMIQKDLFAFANHLLGDRFNSFEYQPATGMDNWGRTPLLIELQQLMYDLNAGHRIAFESAPLNNGMRELTNRCIPRVQKLLVAEQTRIKQLTGYEPSIQTVS